VSIGQSWQTSPYSLAWVIISERTPIWRPRDRDRQAFHGFELDESVDGEQFELDDDGARQCLVRVHGADRQDAFVGGGATAGKSMRSKRVSWDGKQKAARTAMSGVTALRSIVRSSRIDVAWVDQGNQVPPSAPNRLGWRPYVGCSSTLRYAVHISTPVLSIRCQVTSAAGTSGIGLCSCGNF
jgi:hypothetical protein